MLLTLQPDVSELLNVLKVGGEVIIGSFRGFIQNSLFSNRSESLLRKQLRYEFFQLSRFKGAMSALNLFSNFTG